MGWIKCKTCNQTKTFGCFKFTGKKKAKSGRPGTYRKEICLSCDKNKD